MPKQREMIQSCTYGGCSSKRTRWGGANPCGLADRNDNGNKGWHLREAATKVTLALLAVATTPGAATKESPPRHVQCAKTVTGLDYAYGDLRMVQAASSAACCAACSREPLCVLWVKDTGNSTTGNITQHDCFLKKTWAVTPCSQVAAGQPCRRELAGRESMVPAAGPPPAPDPPPIPAPKHFLPVYQLSAKFRNWTYYTGGAYDGFVVPPKAGNFTGQLQVDTAVVFEKTPEDTLPQSSGRYRLWYLYWDSINGQQGYQTALATSDDLVSWSFNQGGDNGIILKRNPLAGSYDYGGVTMGCGFWASSNLTSRRLLRDNQKSAASTGAAAPAHKYYALYGCYPKYGMEAGDGGQGIAWSDDGVVWNRESATVGVLSGGHSKAAAKWESHVVYQPNVVIANATVFDFYNAAGVNEYGKNAEESGFATLPLSKIPGIDHTRNVSLWHRDPRSPVIKSGGWGVSIFDAVSF
jgi:hypothetical protein